MKTDKKIEIKIRGLTKEDEEKAKLMEELVNYQYEKYEGVINTILSAKLYIQEIYPFVKTGEGIWNRILEEVIRMDIKNMEETK